MGVCQEKALGQERVFGVLINDGEVGLGELLNESVLEVLEVWIRGVGSQVWAQGFECLEQRRGAGCHA